MSVKSTGSVNTEAISILGAHKVRELSPSRTSILMPKDILLNMPAKQCKTKLKRRGELSDCMYLFTNKETNYL